MHVKPFHLINRRNTIFQLTIQNFLEWLSLPGKFYLVNVALRTDEVFYSIFMYFYKKKLRIWSDCPEWNGIYDCWCWNEGHSNIFVWFPIEILGWLLVGTYKIVPFTTLIGCCSTFHGVLGDGLNYVFLAIYAAFLYPLYFLIFDRESDKFQNT